MANAMPQALGAQCLDRERQVVAFCGDGGLSMLLGDLMTIKTYRLPVKLVVFDNRRLGMVKLEQEQVGPARVRHRARQPRLRRRRHGAGPHRHPRRPTRPSSTSAVRRAFDTPGPVLLDVLTNPDEVALPPKVTPGDAWGFAVAKLSETLESR